MALDTLGFFSRWEDFRSASLSPPADERAQFPRVGRRGKKLERSTRVCRLRRPCTSDRSGQCQRCRSPPPPSKSSPTYAAPCSTPRDRGSSNRRTGSEDTSGIRVTSGSLMTVLSQQESVTVSRNFVRNFASPLPLLEKLEFSFESWENIPLYIYIYPYIYSFWRSFPLLKIRLIVIIIIVVLSCGFPLRVSFQHLLLTRLEIILWLKIFSNGNFWFFNPVFQKSIDLLKPYFKQASHHLYILTVQNHVVMLHALMDRLFHACSSVSITPSRALRIHTRAYHPSLAMSRKYFQ